MKGFALLAQGGRRIPPCHPPRPSNPEATADFTGYWRLSVTEKGRAEAVRLFAGRAGRLVEEDALEAE